MTRAVLIASLLTALSLASGAQAVTVRAVASDFDFVSDELFEVGIEVEDAQGLTGLEFSIVYPSDRLAVSDPSTHVFHGLFSHGYVNHEADSSDLPPGFRRIRAVFSVAVPVGQPSALLLTVGFPLRCSDYSGSWPEGRPVTIDIRDGAAWTAEAGELPVPSAVVEEDRTVTVDCTTVPADYRGFSTLKARHAGKEGAR